MSNLLWSKFFAVLALLSLALAGCGGGGGNKDENNQPNTLSFDLLVAVSGLDGSVSVGDGKGHNATLSADGVFKIAALPEGSTYAALVTSQPSTQVCSFVRSSGTLQASTTLTLICEDGFNLPLGLSYSVAQVAIVQVDASARAVSATIAGMAITIGEEFGVFTFLMPNLAPGKHQLDVTVDGRTFSKQLTVTSNPLKEPAPQYLASRANAALIDIDSRLATASLEAAERSLLEGLRSTLQAEIANVSAIPAEEALKYAQLLAANEQSLHFAASAGVQMLGARAKSANLGATCLSHAKVFTRGVVIVVAAIGLVNSSLASGPGFPLVAALAVSGAVRGSYDINLGLSGVGRECYRPESVGIDEDDGQAQPAKVELAQRAQRLVKPMAVNVDTYQFDHNVGYPVTPTVFMRLEGVSDWTLALAQRAASIYGSLAFRLRGIISLPPLRALNEAAILPSEKREPVDVSKLLVTSSNSRVVGAATASGNAMLLTFSFNKTPMPVNPEHFDFTVLHTELNVSSEPKAATLAPPAAPVAKPMLLRMFQNGSALRTLPAANVKSYTVTKGSTHGTVEMLDPKTGEFQYTPQPGFIGQDQFEYTVSNELGTSPPGVVSLDVQPACLNARTTPTYYVCGATSPQRLVAVKNPDSNFSGALQENSLFFASEGDYVTYRESATLDSEKSVLAASGVAVFVSAISGNYDAKSDSFTEISSVGTYDSKSTVPVNRTASERRRVTHVRHKDGKSFVVGRASRAYAWHDEVQGLYFAGFTIFFTAQLAGFDAAGYPLYSGERIDCLPAESVEGQRTWLITVSSIDYSNDQLTEVQRYEGACPMPFSSFDSVAPAVTPDKLRVDWGTGSLPP